ncbi:hypothetical protein Pla8534_46360 [Lignipirellula cremea]|uniref:Uncharacterized protein n=1 Tax=Lignipirellula cremea TaxID=2528010 RepID=A0A518DYA8_9BACT|nr:hypothetical protein Pla8534_46360 [Lignipirellula cremea]
MHRQMWKSKRGPVVYLPRHRLSRMELMKRIPLRISWIIKLNRHGRNSFVDFLQGEEKWVSGFECLSDS